jgi:CheY-like chemotaxis protein
MLHLGLIEDNPADVLLIREALRSCPIPADVTIAYDGEEGLRMLTQEGRKFDFVILDLQLPKSTITVSKDHLSLSLQVRTIRQFAIGQ